MWAAKHCSSLFIPQNKLFIFSLCTCIMHPLQNFKLHVYKITSHSSFKCLVTASQTLETLVHEVLNDNIFLFCIDVLSGVSSFRTLQSVTERFNQDAMFPCYQTQHTGYFSSNMLPENYQHSPTELEPSNGISLVTKKGANPQQHFETDDRSNLVKKTWI